MLQFCAGRLSGLVGGVSDPALQGDLVIICGGVHDLGAQGTKQQALQVDAHAGGDALGDLGGGVDDVADQLGGVALAVHGDLVHLGERFGHVLGDLGQSGHDHLHHGGLAVLAHGLGLLVDTLGLSQGLGTDGLGFCTAHGGDALGLLFPGEALGLGDLHFGCGLLLLLVAAGFGILLALEQLRLCLLLLTVALGVGLGADLCIQGLLLNFNFSCLQLGLPLGLGDVGVGGGACIFLDTAGG